jgi:uncharacterized Zn-binding protein involved in type VI secretion
MLPLHYPARVDDPIAHDLTVEGAETGVIAGLAIGLAAAAVVILTVVTAGADLPVLMLISMVTGVGAAGGTAGAGISGYVHKEKDKIKGRIDEGSYDVKIEGKRAARVGDECQCQDHGHEEKIRTGCREVLVNLRPLARETDETDHAGVVYDGAHSVAVGGSTFTFGEQKGALEGTAVQTAIETLSLTSTIAEAGEMAPLADFVAGRILAEGSRALESPEVVKAIAELAKKGFNVQSYVAEQVAKRRAGEDAFITKVLVARNTGHDLYSPYVAIREGHEIAEEAEHGKEALSILKVVSHGE